MAWRRLGTFWKHSDCSVRVKLNVYDAVIRTKLIYGLESVQLNDSLKSQINAFQLKELRQILKLHTTFIDRANSNAEVFRRANAHVWSASGQRTIIPISEFYENQRRKLVMEIIRAPFFDPIRNVCANDSLKLVEHPCKGLVGLGITGGCPR